MIEGYRAPIHRGVWERHTVLGAPTYWSIIWVALALYLVILCLFKLGAAWILAVGTGWMLGQVALAALTHYDPDWDSIVIRSLSKRRQSYYDVG